MYRVPSHPVRQVYLKTVLFRVVMYYSLTVIGFIIFLDGGAGVFLLPIFLAYTFWVYYAPLLIFTVLLAVLLWYAVRQQQLSLAVSYGVLSVLAVLLGRGWIEFIPRLYGTVSITVACGSIAGMSSSLFALGGLYSRQHTPVIWLERGFAVVACGVAVVLYRTFRFTILQ